MPKTVVYECDVVGCLTGSSLDGSKFLILSVPQTQGYDKSVYLCPTHQVSFSDLLNGTVQTNVGK